MTAQPCSARSFKQRPLARLNITWRGAESDRAARPASWPERVGRAYSRAVHRAARLAARAAALVQVRVTEWALAAGVSPRAQRALRVAFELWGIIVEAAEVLLLVRARPAGRGGGGLRLRARDARVLPLELLSCGGTAGETTFLSPCPPSQPAPPVSDRH